MSNRIAEIKSVIGSGARPNKYKVYLSFPTAIEGIDSSTEGTVHILCKSAEIPNRSLGQIEVYNQGRKFVLPGDTNYSNSFNLGFYNTEEHNIRRAMLQWMKSIDHFQANSHSGVPSDLMTTVKVCQLDSAENETVTYVFKEVFPSEVSSINLGADSNDQIEEYDVTFTFSDWVVSDKDENDNPTEYENSTKNKVSTNL